MKIKIAAILLVTLILCSGCGFHPVMQDSSSVSQESKIETKQFVSAGIGIQLEYPSNWYVDGADVDPHFEILYSAQAKANIYLLNEKLDLSKITQEKFSKLLSDNYIGDWDGFYSYHLGEVKNYATYENDQMEWVQLSGDIDFEYCNNSVDYIGKPPRTVIWYFINLKNGVSLFVRYEDCEEQGTLSSQIDETFEKTIESMDCIANPVASEYAYAIEKIIAIDE